MKAVSPLAAFIFSRQHGPPYRVAGIHFLFLLPFAFFSQKQAVFNNVHPDLWLVCLYPTSSTLREVGIVPCTRYCIAPAAFRFLATSPWSRSRAWFFSASSSTQRRKRGTRRKIPAGAWVLDEAEKWHAYRFLPASYGDDAVNTSGDIIIKT